MFTPFIQYTIDGQDLSGGKNASGGQEGLRPANVVDIVEVVGCLEQSLSSAWTLSHANDAAVSRTQSTSSTALKAAAAKPLGNAQYQLLGVDAFHASSHKGQTVAVKGVLIKSTQASRINVTSLQTITPVCPGRPPQ